MNLSGKVIIVTGASEGIGKTLCANLVKVGAKVVGCARNIEALSRVADDLNGCGIGEMCPVKCDITNEIEFLSVFKFVEEKYAALHAIVNNAGMSETEPLLTGKSDGWMRMLQVNVMGVAIGSREAVKLMKKVGVGDGHIVNVNSISGHIGGTGADTHFYGATKFAVTALTEGLRQELRKENSHIRVSGISPGLVETEFASRSRPHIPGFANKLYSSIVCLQPQDIADGILYALQAPPRVNVSDIIIRPTEQVF